MSRMEYGIRSGKLYAVRELTLCSETNHSVGQNNQSHDLVLFRAGFWATRETEDTTTNRELYIRTTLRELFVYLMFLITTLVSMLTTAFPSVYLSKP